MIEKRHERRQSSFRTQPHGASPYRRPSDGPVQLVVRPAAWREILLCGLKDTDRDRSTDAAIDAIVNGMRWVGLDWDEGPHRQSDRLDLYRQKAMALLERGQAYWCVCTPEELEARRKEAQAKGEPLNTMAGVGNEA